MSCRLNNECVYACQLECVRAPVFYFEHTLLLRIILNVEVICVDVGHSLHIALPLAQGRKPTQQTTQTGKTALSHATHGRFMFAEKASVNRYSEYASIVV